VSIELESPTEWDISNEKKQRKTLSAVGKEDIQNLLNRAAFDGERIVFNFEGAMVGIVPLEDLMLLEEVDPEQ